MYTALIVDDEYYVIDGLKESIPWNSLGISTLLTAANGAQAYNILMETPVDIIITDIKMPVMDGIELIQRLRQKNYKCKVIVISGFDSFDYATRLITYNVIDYLLKPVTVAQMKEAVVKAVNMCKDDETEDRKRQMIEKHLAESLPLLLDKFYTELLKGNFEEELAQFLNINADCCTYQITLFHIDNINSLPSIYSPDPEHNRQMAVANLYNILSGTAFDTFTFSLVRHINHNIIMVIQHQSENIDDNNTVSKLQALKDSIAQTQEYTVSIGIGKKYSSLRYISESYREAKAVLRHKVFTGNNTILVSDDVDPAESAQLPYLINERNQLRDCLNSQNIKDLDDILERMKQKLVGTRVNNLQYIRTLGMELVISASLFLYERNEDLINILEDYSDPVSYIASLETVDDIFFVIGDIYQKIIHYLDNKVDVKNQRTVQFIKDFVQNNIQNDISLEILSQHLFLTPNYIGLIFKNSTGMYFSDYVLKARMEKAEQLLTNPAYKIYEVADMVGYKNSTYFSKLFKEYTGMKPSDYQK